MKKIEDLELKKQILNKTYYNNYLLRIAETDVTQFKSIMNDHVIFETDDNLYIILNIGKPSIDKDLWFDDEQPIPEKTVDLFIKYNMMMNGSKLTRYNEDIENAYLYNPYRGAKQGLASILCQYKCDKIDDLTYYRDLKEDEKIFIQTFIDVLVDEYIERLKKYYKRYNDKIHCRGYWVDR